MKIPGLLFGILTVSIAVNICGVDDGQEQFLFMLLMREKGLSAQSTVRGADTQKVSAVGLLKEFDSAYEKRDITSADEACCKFKWLVAMDWRYLTQDQKVQYCGKMHNAKGLLNTLKGKKSLSAISQEELAIDMKAAQWLIDRINKGLCTREAWKGFIDDVDNQFPETNVLNAERIAYLKRAGKPQEMAEQDVLSTT